MIPQDNNYYISPGNTSICINVQAVPDDIVETNETFSISLTFNNPLDSVTGSQSVTIVDDDGMEACIRFRCIALLLASWVSTLPLY